MQKRLTKVPYWRNSDGEESLMIYGTPQEKKEYILWYGINTPTAQKILAENGDKYLVWLQTYIYGNIWDKGARDILYKKGLLALSTPEEENVSRQAFLGWLGTCLYGDRTDEANYGRLQSFWLNYDGKTSPAASEEEQLKWFDRKDRKKILAYPYFWTGRAVQKFFLEAPEEAVYRYLHYNILKDEEMQRALVQRDMQNNTNSLIWYYFSGYRAFPSVQKLIQEYDSLLWQKMIPINYGWDHKFEKKFGNLRNWHEKLENSWPLLARCPIEDIPAVLETIK